MYANFAQASKTRLGKNSRKPSLVIHEHLAQVSVSHLGEKSCFSRWFCLSTSLRRRDLRLGNKASRLGERYSPKREVVTSLEFCWTRRLSEGFGFRRMMISPKREEARLSETS